MKVLVTGASGFVGGALVVHLAATADTVVVACSRRPCVGLPARAQRLVVSRYDDDPDLARALVGVDVVVHAAARAHVLRDDAQDPLEEFRNANIRTTCHLARRAAVEGVGRFVFISSIGVNGDATVRPFTESDPPAPVGDYGRAKLEAEHGLAEIAAGSGLQMVVVRPPLVHGRGAPGNFARLVRLARSGLPLPFAGVRNRRSIVGIGNLCDFLAVVAGHPAAANETFLVADSRDVSTEELLSILRRGMGLKPRLFAMPHGLVPSCLSLVRRGRLAHQLYGDLQVSFEKARVRLGWTPPHDTIESLMAAVRHDPGERS